jgi:dolichyl-phosphate beta-glucosyltransferase
MDPLISIIIPVHRRISQLKPHIETLLTHEYNSLIKEILICHNGPALTEVQAAVALEEQYPKVRALHTDVPGLGAGNKMGISASTGEFVLMTAGDLPFGFSDFERWLELYRKGNVPEIVIGSKLHPATVSEGRKFIRVLATFFFMLLKKVLIPFPMPADSQGTVFMLTSAAKQLAPVCFSDGFFFTTELIVRGLHKGLAFCEVPVIYYANEGGSSVSPLREGINFTKGLWRLRKDLF